MGLIDDDRVISAQERVPLGLGEQNPIGHQLDGGLGPELIIEPDLVPNNISQRGSKLLCNSFGHGGGGDSPRLRVSDPLGFAALLCIHAAAAQCQSHFG